MIPLRYKWRCIIYPLIILAILQAIIFIIFEKTRPPEPLVIISPIEQTEFANPSLSNTTINFLSYPNSSHNISLVKSDDDNYANEVIEEIPKEKGAKQFILYQAIWECLCSRRFMYPPLSPLNQTQKIIKLNSSCSDEGTHYQPNQKVISMSLFIPSRPTNTKYSESSYQIGLLQNLVKMRQHYPSYSLRIYTNASLSPNSSWCKLLCENEDLFWCDIRRTPSDGNLVKMEPRSWRFLALGDPTVQIFHSRDLDCLIGYREGAAVLDWLENVGYKTFQLMRDKQYYHNVPILGGMWSAQNKRLLGLGKSRGAKLRKQIIQLSQKKKGYGTDQNMLNRLIVSDRAKDVVAYDSYHCKQWSNKTMVRPFPVQRQGIRDFVGNTVNFTGDGKGKIYTTKEKDLKCPLECRPNYGKDWIYC